MIPLKAPEKLLNGACGEIVVWIWMFIREKILKMCERRHWNARFVYGVRCDTRFSHRKNVVDRDTDLTSVDTCTHTQWHNQSYDCFLCCPGNAASSCLVDTCGSAMRTRLPGECGSGGGGCELNLPAPLAHFLFLCDQRGGSGFYRTSVCQCVEILCSKVVCVVGGTKTLQMMCVGERWRSCFMCC